MPSYLTPKRFVLFTLLFGFIFAAFLAVGFGYFLLNPANKQGQEQVFMVPEGATLQSVASDLEAKELITSRRLFLVWARIMGSSRNIKAGEYRLHAGMPPIKILENLTKGLVIAHSVTIPEGFTKNQIADLLDKGGFVNKQEFLSLCANAELVQSYGIQGRDLEGYLYPDTYQFSHGLHARAVIDTMVRRFFEVFGPFRERADEQGMSLKDLVTLASIVEKETGLAAERPVIASVFLNRLKKGMRLESDPTVIYGLKAFDGDLTKKHLAKKTPYNTYRIRGLPPGPIANAGRDAINAVLFPAKTSYLYFVSKNDGSHYFSKTLKEHNKAVRIYQKQKRRRSRKSS